MRNLGLKPRLCTPGVKESLAAPSWQPGRSQAYSAGAIAARRAVGCAEPPSLVHGTQDQSCGRGCNPRTRLLPAPRMVLALSRISSWNTTTPTTTATARSTPPAQIRSADDPPKPRTPLCDECSATDTASAGAVSAPAITTLAPKASPARRLRTNIVLCISISSSTR
jgi:hypothetical protein